MFRLPVAELGLVDGVGGQVVLRRLVLSPQDVPSLALLLQLVSQGEDLHETPRKVTRVRSSTYVAAHVSYWLARM